MEKLKIMFIKISIHGISGAVSYTCTENIDWSHPGYHEMCTTDKVRGILIQQFPLKIKAF